MQYVIGIDYGTRSARAVLVEAETGRIQAAHTVCYPHGVMDGGLASGEDYENALMELLEVMSDAPGCREGLRGICVDATSLTLVSLDHCGMLLGKTPEFFNRPHAQIQLWKRHTAAAQAREALALARQRNEPFLQRTGGSISAEWMLPKLLEMRDEAPDIYEKMDMAMDLCDFLTYRLTGIPARSTGSLSYKGLWAADLGFPSDEYLNSLRPGFSAEYRYLLRGPVYPSTGKAGKLLPALRSRFGLQHDVAIAAGMLDGHVALASVGSLAPGEAAITVGTSCVVTLQSPQCRNVLDVCGIAKDSQVPGLWGVDAGQNGAGDMLEWYMENALPASCQQEANRRRISPHALLATRITHPWKNTVTAVDWWSGSRNVPCDLSLQGSIQGLSMNTHPEDIYLALLQGIACSTRTILETCENAGIAVHDVRLSGGMARKSPLLMQEYAGILNMPVAVAQEDEGPALGAALFAAVAAGIYRDLPEAYMHMGIRQFQTYRPDPAHQADYEALYLRSRRLRASIIQNAAH